MTVNPVVAEVTDSVRAVLGKLLELDIRHLPVVEDGRLAGIVSDRDLREVSPLVLREAAAGKIAEALERPVSSLMSSDVVSVDPESDVSEVVDLMIEQRIGAVPVVDPETGALAGIVSYVDILRAARDVL